MARIFSMKGPEYAVSKPILIGMAVLFALYIVGCSRNYQDVMATYEETLPASYIAEQDVTVRMMARQHASHWIFENVEDIDPWADFPDAIPTDEQEDL